MATSKRPLSPHLQVYKPQITSFTSIFHRGTGAALSAGLVLLAAWLACAAAGQESFDAMQGFIGSIVGRLLLFGWTLALFYHLCNGIRHLLWDIGVGLTVPAAVRSGVIVIAAAVILTVLAWVAGYSMAA